MASSSNDPDQWSDLPTDHIADISKRLLRMDRHRFRSVCTSWRSFSSIPRTLTSLLNSVKLPFPVPDTSASSSSSSLFQTGMISLDPDDDDDTDGNFDWLSGVLEFRRYYLESVTDPKRNGFVATKVNMEEEEARPDEPRQGTTTTFLNLLDYHVYEMFMGFVIVFIREDWGKRMRFSVVSSVKNGEVVDCCEVRLMGISDTSGVLMHWKWGDEKWTVIEDIWSVSDDVDEESFWYVDVVYRKGKEEKGKFYAVDDCGNVAIIDEELKVEVVKWPLAVDRKYKDRESKFLLESDGNLYLVIDRQYCKSGNKFGRGYVSDKKDDVRIMIFRLDDTQKKWKRVRKLGDRVFFVGRLTSFAVDGRSYPLLGTNCVYFGAPGIGKSAGQQVLCVFDVASGFWCQLSNSHGTKGSLVSLPAPR